ncbi:hypothetical protein MSPP1_001569 [Malassezia sp. CBS 17886]|nr:hypothetical protein MSPP1_001569 [Malassezia sp. CBS 17886]
MAPEEALQEHLDALERACAVRRAVLACVEHSFAVVQQLAQRGAAPGGDVRTLLRERDELALDILRTQRALEGHRSRAREAGKRIDAALARRAEEETPRGTRTQHGDNTHGMAPSARDAAQRRQLLRGTLLVRNLLPRPLTKKHVALQCDIPWCEDDQLADLLLSMDDEHEYTSGGGA